MGFFGDLWSGVKKAASGVGNFIGEVTGYNAAQRTAENQKLQTAAAEQQAAQREQAWQQYQDYANQAKRMFSNMYEQQGKNAANYTEGIGKSRDTYAQLSGYAGNVAAAGDRAEAAGQAGA